MIKVILPSKEAQLRRILETRFNLEAANFDVYAEPEKKNKTYPFTIEAKD